MTWKLFLIFFIALSSQAGLTWFQFKKFRSVLKEVRGPGKITGVGHIKGGMRPGEILLLTFSKDNEKVIDCLRMRGYTVFARFKPVADYNGMSLEAVRKLGLEEDAKRFKRRRKKHKYDPEEMTKKKGALIQAVEAAEKRMIEQKNKIVVKRPTEAVG